MPHISYHHVNYFDLKYANKVSGTWRIQTVEASGHTGSQSTIAVDGNDSPFISYTQSPDRLKIAYWNGSRWISQTVESGPFGAYNSLALTDDGVPRISYYETAPPAVPPL